MYIFSLLIMAIVIVNPFVADYISNYIGLNLNVLIILLNVILVGLVLTWYILRDRQERKRIEEKIKKIREGDYRQKITLSESSKYYFMCRHLNKILRDIRGLFKNLIKSTVTITEEVDELGDSVDDIFQMADDITGAIEEVAVGAENQSINMEDVSDKFSEITELMEKANKRLKEIVDSSQNASQISEEGEQLLTDLKQDSRKNRELIQESGKEIESLQENFKEVIDIVDSIKEIASQTDLLALNASIEAARAGKEGRGFGVLASEIRDFSLDVDKLAQQISKVIEKVNQQIDFAAESMDNNIEIIEKQDQKIDNIDDTISDLNEIVKNNFARIEELHAATSTILESTAEAEDSFDQVLSIAQQTAANSEEVSASADNQRSFLSDIDEMTDGLNQSAVEMQQMSASRIMNKTMLNICYEIKEVRASQGLDKQTLNQIKTDSNVDDIYIVNQDGEFILSTVDGILGENLFEINEWARQFGEDKDLNQVVTPIHRRIEDDKLFKFAMIRDDDGTILEVGLSLDSLVNL